MNIYCGFLAFKLPKTRNTKKARPNHPSNWYDPNVEKHRLKILGARALAKIKNDIIFPVMAPKWSLP